MTHPHPPTFLKVSVLGQNHQYICQIEAGLNENGNADRFEPGLDSSMVMDTSNLTFCQGPRVGQTEMFVRDARSGTRSRNVQPPWYRMYERHHETKMVTGLVMTQTTPVIDR